MESINININNIVMGDEPTYENQDIVTLPQCHLYLNQRHHSIASKTFEGIDPEGTHSFAVFVSTKNEKINCFWEKITHIERYPEQERLEVFRLVKGHWQHLQHPCLLQERDYHVRQRANDAYQQVLFQAGCPLQSAELNDLQQQTIVQSRTLANTLYQNGYIPEGRERVISIDQHEAKSTLKVAACSVYIDGYFYAMPPLSAILDASKDTTLGVYLSFQVIDSDTDTALTDPAMGHANAGQKGAKRLQATCVWGFDDAISAQTSIELAGKFYAVQRIVKAQIVNSDVDEMELWVQNKLVNNRRDLWGGHYILDGFEVSLVSTEEEQAVDASEDSAEEPSVKSLFHIGKGKAHVQGFEVVVPEGKVLHHERQPWPVQYEQEACSLKENNSLQLAHQPVYTVQQVQVKQTKARHTAVFKDLNTQVPISDTDEDVAEVLRVFVGDQVFEINKDYKVLNQSLEWLPEFQALSNNSTFSIEYTHWETLETSRYSITPLNPIINARYVQIEDEALLSQANLTYRVDYTAYGLRHHELALTPHGEFKFFDSETAEADTMPLIPENHLVLARFQSTNHVDGLQNVALRSLSMQTVHTMFDRIEHLYQLVAEERLARQAQSDNPSEHGIFIDSFYHDQQRDAHAEDLKIVALLQDNDTKAIIGVASARDGVLSLPKEFQPARFIDIQLEKNTHGAHMLPLAKSGAYQTVFEQSKATSSMKINPYMAYAPMPAQVKLTPAVDHWHESRYLTLSTRNKTRDNRNWSAHSTETSVSSWMWERRRRSRSRWQRSRTESRWQHDTSSSVSSRQERTHSTQSMQYMRSRTVQFELKGFAKGERIRVTMDGRLLTATITGGS